jgi:hypothetical protein
MLSQPILLYLHKNLLPKEKLAEPCIDLKIILKSMLNRIKIGFVRQMSNKINKKF